MGKGCNVIGTEDLREAIEEGAAAGVVGERVIDREEQAIDADHVKGTTQGWMSEVAAGGDVDVRLKIGGDRLAKMGRGARQDATGSGQCGRQSLTHVAND